MLPRLQLRLFHAVNYKRDPARTSGHARLNLQAPPNIGKIEGPVHVLTLDDARLSMPNDDGIQISMKVTWCSIIERD